MDPQDFLSREFEQNRAHLRRVAYRMLGSLAEADDAVQEAWLRLSRSNPSAIENLRAWLTTVVANVSLDMLRSRKARSEDSIEESNPVTSAPPPDERSDPEQEAILAESVGLALLVVLDTLAPAERLAFVLHDMFAVSFEEIATIVGRSPEAARQLASRARRRVQGTDRSPSDLKQQKEVVDAFLAALRAGDFEALVRLLDPDLVFRVDATAGAGGAAGEIRGAEAWARQAITFARGARFAQPALVDGTVGVVVAPRGRLFRVLRLTLKNGKVAEVEVIGDPERLKRINLAILED